MADLNGGLEGGSGEMRPGKGGDMKQTEGGKDVHDYRIFSTCWSYIIGEFGGGMRESKGGLGFREWMGL